MEAAKQTTPFSQVQVVPNQELSSEQYHAERGHVSSSQLIHVLRTPAHYRYHSLQGSTEESDLMRLGTAAHCLVLEPDEFPNRYVFAPRSYDKRKTLDKNELAAIELAHPGLTVLEPKEVAILEKIEVGIRNHALANKLLRMPGRPESSIFWRDPLTQLDLKVRIDKDVDFGSSGVMVEVKTTDDASEAAFAKKIVDMDYDLRAVMYADGMQQAYGFTPDIVWIVIERETGFVATYRPSPQMLQRGRKRYEGARIALAHAQAFKSWPAYQSGETIETVNLPRWVRN